MRHPYQQMKPLITEIVSRGLQARAARRRASIATNGEFDWAITAKVAKGIQAPDRTLLQRINAMGIWTQSILCHAGSEDTDLCPHCGQAKEDWRHMWWKCPKFCSVRQKWWPKGRPPFDSFPAALLNAGVSPGLVLSREGALWGGAVEGERCEQ
eukprot:9352013-Alexandrium_andersonii.AAC.1